MPILTMPAFPIPVFAAAVLAWYLVRALARREGPAILLALLAVSAGQALITALSCITGRPGPGTCARSQRLPSRRWPGSR